MDSDAAPVTNDSRIQAFFAAGGCDVSQGQLNLQSAYTNGLAVPKLPVRRGLIAVTVFGTQGTKVGGLAFDIFDPDGESIPLEMNSPPPLEVNPGSGHRMWIATPIFAAYTKPGSHLLAVRLDGDLAQAARYVFDIAIDPDAQLQPGD